MEYGGENLKQFIQNANLNTRNMKILFYNIAKAFLILRKNNIVHNDISPFNILAESPEKVKIIDFTESFVCTQKYEDNQFPLYNPSKWNTELYLSPELMSWYRMAGNINSLKYDPYKSSIFSIGLSILSSCGIDIKGLNYFGEFYDIHIMEILTISYNFVVKDSLRMISYKKLRKELQFAIDKKIKEFPYDFLKLTLRRMLEVDIVERATFEKIYNDAKFNIDFKPI
ncbi:hypothetical protein SteCoe_12392 [Stentor coeruleus]|uniref:Protein kinase domain-containing protein n=1 Tax=Stentor coeruleus TaxID=5963 RepID=A0A1R2CAU0_9CILI|nr:hypothetical protein SteCoe_12392 [Stentor coeruleus]